MSSFFTSIEPIQPMSFSSSIEALKPLPFDKASPAVENRDSDSSAIPFADILKDAVANYADINQTANAGTQALALGDVDNLAQLQIDSMKASAALSTTVQLTSRVVSAYKEIMQMQV